MKIRRGFVSNSSSSSFICDVCGYVIEGWDGDYDGDHAVCENHGHEMCRCANNDKNFIYYNERKGYTEDDVEWDDEAHWENRIIEDDCPVCQFKVALNLDIIAYLLKELKTTEKEILEKWRKQFKSYEEFQQYLKGK